MTMTTAFQEMIETYQELQHTNNKSLPQAIVQRFKQQVFQSLVTQGGRPTGFFERYDFKFNCILEKHPEGLDNFFSQLKDEVVKEPCLDLQIQRDPDYTIGVREDLFCPDLLPDCYIIIYYKPSV